MKKIIYIVAFLALTASCDPHPKPSPDPTPTPGVTGFRTVDDVIKSAKVVVNSHGGEEAYSSLQPMAGSYKILPHSWCMGDSPQKTAMYPRIKCLKDGGYILFYHGDKLGSRVFCTRSDDLVSWSDPQLLFSPYSVTSHGITDMRRFVNPDAVVLPSGEVLLVVSYREEKTYKDYNAGGLMLVRSSDGGVTWSDPKIIYDKANWEPYLLLLPDGRLQCYFTDTTPLIRNSGTAMIASSDGGGTWSSKIRVSAQYKRDYDGDATAYTGTPIYTDQMPCFRVLGDGKTIIGALEGRIEEPNTETGTSQYWLSVVYNNGLDWKDLGTTSAGPEHRYTNIFHAAAGYLSVFSSGEVVVSCNSDSYFLTKILAADGELPEGETWDSSWLRSLPSKGFWGSTEVLSPKTLLCAMHCGSGESSPSTTGLQLQKLYLNHRIDAPQVAVTLDGNACEFPLDDALYLPSTAGDETIITAAHSEDMLYLAFETRLADSYATAPAFTLSLASENNPKKSIGARIYSDGSVTGSSLKWASARQVSASRERGLVTEIAVPLASLGVSAGDYVLLYASSVVNNKETVFTGAVFDNPASWQRIKIK